jgi:hypothetical protein
MADGARWSDRRTSGNHQALSFAALRGASCEASGSNVRRRSLLGIVAFRHDLRLVSHTKRSPILRSTRCGRIAAVPRPRFMELVWPTVSDTR